MVRATEKAIDVPILRKKIGGTVYIVTGTLSDSARETAVDKMRRIILNEAETLAKASD